MTSFDKVRLLSGYSDGLAFARNEERFGFVNKKGELVIILDKLELNEESPYSFNFSEGIAGLNIKNGGIIFIDKRGKILFHKNYESCTNFTNGFAVVLLKDDYGVIDKQGNLIVPFKKGFVDFSEGIFRREIEGKGWEYFNFRGKILFKIKYDYSGNFYDGLAVVGNNNKWGFIDKTGKIKIKIKFDDARDFNEGLAPINIGQKWGFINKNGTLVIPANLDYIENEFSNGLAYVHQGDWEGYINKKGVWVWKKKIE